MNDELKPCPFCGEKQRIQITFCRTTSFYWGGVECETCGSTGPENTRSDVEAIAGWNTRATSSADERQAQIVKWLETDSAFSDAAKYIAERIKRGDHLK